MKKVFLGLLFFTAALKAQTLNYTPLSVTVTTGDAPLGVIWNPERGFYYDASTIDDDYVYTGAPFQYTLLTDGDCQEAINRGCSLIHRIIRLDDYKTNPTIHAAFLANIQADLNKMKAWGLKCVLRFSYSYYEDYQNHTGHVYDAEESIIFSHITQLKAVTRLPDNEPVISSIEAGFIGNWGEWHYSFNYADPWTGAVTPTQQDARNRIGKKILELGVSRLVAYRTPFIQRQLTDVGLKATPVVNAVPGNGDGETAPASRVAAHNDCFLSDTDDQGTYDIAGSPPYSVDRLYLKTQSAKTFDGGEFCGLDENYANLTGTPTGPDGSYIGNALTQMKEFHFSYLNSANGNNNDFVTHYWNTHSFSIPPYGTYLNEVRRKLGYRFELVSTVLNTTTKEFKINLKNVGFAKLFNFRKVYLVFRSTAAGANPPEYRVRIMNADPREWLPDPVSPATYTLTKSLINMVTTNGAGGVAVPSGTYKLYLYMPDNNTSLNLSAQSLRYAIRFANANQAGATFWNTATPTPALAGYNNLYRTVTINNEAGTVAKMGSDDSILFEATAYPNPFATAFNIKVNTVGEEPISLDVYDMLGRLVDAKKSNPTDVNSLEIGTEYPTGVYTIIISQGDSKQSIRVIKK